MQQDHRILVFESCDPGRKAVVGQNSSDEVLGLVLTRTYLSAILGGQIGDEFSRCASNRLIHNFSAEELGQTGKPDAALTARVAEVVAPCR